MSKLCSWNVEISSCEQTSALYNTNTLNLRRDARPLHNLFLLQNIMRGSITEQNLKLRGDLAEVDGPPGVPTGVRLRRERHQTQNTRNHRQQRAVAAGHGRHRRLQQKTASDTKVKICSHTLKPGVTTGRIYKPNMNHQKCFRCSFNGTDC